MRRARPARAVRTDLDALEGRRLPATILVTGAGHALAADGVVTLREALTAANGDAPSGDAPAGEPGLDTIAFDIPGAGAHAIRPASPRPAITAPVLIDGCSQPG